MGFIHRARSARLAPTRRWIFHLRTCRPIATTALRLTAGENEANIRPFLFRADRVRKV
jgi:hypothetical protein